MQLGAAPLLFYHASQSLRRLRNSVKEHFAFCEAASFVAAQPANKSGAGRKHAEHRTRDGPRVLADFKIPREVRLVDGMPRSILEKVAKVELRKLPA